MEGNKKLEIYFKVRATSSFDKLSVIGKGGGR
jgi:hypothetical protein